MGVIGRLSVSTLQAQTVKKIWQSIAVLQQSPHGGEDPRGTSLPGWTESIAKMQLSLITLCTLGIGATAVQAALAPNSTWPVQSYNSTKIRASVLETTKMGETDPGYIFVTPWNGHRSGHPSIYKDDGQLVWQGPEGTIFGFRPQNLSNNPMLVFWEGDFTGTGYGHGAVNLLNSSYHLVHKVTLTEGYFNTGLDHEVESHIDYHEGIVENDKKALLVAAANITQADLRSVGGPEEGWVIDGLIYDIDIETNKVLFRWSAVEHIDQIPFKLSQRPLLDTGTSEKNPWDFFRVSSTVRYGDDYLISWDYGCSVLHIARNGSVAWNLNGITGGDFKMKPNSKFCFQYGLRLGMHTDEKITISMHNNDNSEFSNTMNPTTGLVLDLDLKKMEVVGQRRMWNHEHPIVSRDLGSFQALGTGHCIVHHGQIPLIEEYNKDDELVMQIRYGHDLVDASYRVHRVSWTGMPITKPSVKACRKADKDIVVYVSWNGSTDIESWKVFEVSEGSMPKEIKDEAWTGFETTIQAQSEAKKVLVAAVGGYGNGVESDPVTVDEC
ncbi:hypothetical protein H112_00898 [Trichophyton rubrum D6]|uniref:ASST-domain-containing protein n=2 Tax=Trichophyton TaxID=5550 RepID=A0A022WF91_TRIRU|nr:hypothetical protein H103_00896 [Trichophyton rubrum CBS 288.86]EZF67341.1 hypothetical protein H104_00881 [Trichophyton rubrum CBS 289.86]EZF78054.1 hypothetical protein H105_00896 [Trichophyton soudanense CBS 452.61]KDB37897.1 hypothetical protein H112_00898 [Trichophyton rubrum D6]KMQ44422.1 hypothetical protein HL42_4920 [Trichophyton rubrum]